MLERMIGAARLDVHVYEEVEADTGATTQAIMVVLLVALATGVGALGLGGGVGRLVFGIFTGLLWWAVFALVTYLVGTTVLRTPETEANWGQLARTTGFAQSPGLLRVFGFIPGIGLIIVFAVTLWQLATMVIAVRQALDYRSTWRAVGVVIIGAIISVIILGIAEALFFGSGSAS